MPNPFFLSILVFALAAHAGGLWEMDLSDGRTAVEFTAIARPGSLKVQGRTRDKGAAYGKWTVDGGSRVSGYVKYKLDALDTGIGMRTRHMKQNYLEISKWPESSLQLTQLHLPQPLVGGDFVAKEEPFRADLTLHGETKPISGKVALERRGDSLRMTFQFPVSLKQFKIPPPIFMGIHLDDEVQVLALVNATLKKTSTP